MIRKLLCLLGFHKWWKTCVVYCLAPAGYVCAGIQCSKCKYYRDITCKYCGRYKK